MLWLYGPFNETAPAGVDPAWYHQSKQPFMIAADTIFITLLVTAVFLRFLSRYLSGGQYKIDDWLCLISMPFSMSLPVMSFVNISNAVGRHTMVASNTNPNLITQYNKNVFGVFFFFNLGLCTFKWTILATYCRIFTRVIWIRQAAIVLSVLIGMWLLVIELVHVFRCDPIASQWNPSITGKCIMSQGYYWYLQAVPTIAFDLVILLLPIRATWQVKVSKWTRVGIIVIFSMGGMATLITIIRFHLLVKVVKENSPDYMYNFITVCLMFDFESTAGVISACLITYGPLFRVAGRKIGSLTPKRFLSRSSFSKITPFASRRERTRTPDLATDQSGKGSSDVTIMSIEVFDDDLKHNAAVHREYDIERLQHQIHVQHELTVIHAR